MELEPILHIWVHKDDISVDLTITKTVQSKTTKSSSEVIHTNKKHPFLTVEKGFLPVGQMKIGMHVVEASGQVGVISGWRSVPGVMTMYNLEIQQDHTYTVGVGMWVVHNSGPCGNEPPPNLPAKLEPPAHPAGMTRSQFGKDVMQWGTGSDVPRQRMGTITREEMEQGGVTSEMARNWRDFYRNEMIRNSSNPSAPGRADLMDYVNKILSGADQGTP